MIKIDISLRDVIGSLPHKFIYILTHKKGIELLDTSLPKVKDKRADLIVLLEDKSIFHLEIQTFNDSNMAYRMLEYFFLIKEKYHNENIFQMVLYVGDKKLKMQNNINLKNLKFNYSLKNIKEINCEEMINSDDLDDKILAVLCNIKNEDKYLNNILQILLKLDYNKRKDYILKLLSLSRYRPKINDKLLNLIKEEVMPITIELKNDPYFKQGLQQGLQEGELKGKITILKELGLSEKEISHKLHISIEKIRHYLKDKPF